MASFFNISSRFGRQTNKPPTGQGQMPSLSPTLSPTSPSSLSASAFSPISTASSTPFLGPQDTNMTDDVGQPRSVPFFFREENSILIAKGNFLTLAAKPAYVDKGEWLAHQVVEQYRLLEGLLRVIQEPDSRTGVPLCNNVTCPVMTASSYVYTWLDSQRNNVRIPAPKYIFLVQKWIMNKINDAKIFPTDTTFQAPSTYASGGTNTPGSGTPIPAGPTNLNASLLALSGNDWVGKASGFPESYETDVKNLYRQMCRCYSHIYHNHWLDPFWHVGAHKELNTCYIHFVTVGKLFDLLVEKDLKPMQPLLDIWTEKGLLPATVLSSSGQASQGRSEMATSG